MKWLKSKNKIISEMRSVQFQYIITVSTDTNADSLVTQTVNGAGFLVHSSQN